MYQLKVKYMYLIIYIKMVNTYEHRYVSSIHVYIFYKQIFVGYFTYISRGSISAAKSYNCLFILDF